MEKKLFFYSVKIVAENIFWAIVAIILLIMFYQFLFHDATQKALGQIENSTIEFGISVITITAPLFAIMETLVSWLKSIREKRIKTELIKIVEALSKSPSGMDIDAIDREAGLPDKVILERISELILIGRVNVKLTTNYKREYSLK